MVPTIINPSDNSKKNTVRIADRALVETVTTLGREGGNAIEWDSEDSPGQDVG